MLLNAVQTTNRKQLKVDYIINVFIDKYISNYKMN